MKTSVWIAFGLSLFLLAPSRADDSDAAKELDKPDYATVELGHAWDFTSPDLLFQKPTHCVAELVKEGDKNVFVVTADGDYQSPIIGLIPRTFDGDKYHRFVMRVRHEGPTSTSLLINDKTYVKDSAGGIALKDTFDIYTADMKGQPFWGSEVHEIKFRWGYRPGDPTAKDKIIIDWIRLLAD